MKDIILQLFGTRWFLFALVGFLLFLSCGVWVFSTPAYETMYNHRTLPPVQTEKVRVHCHILEIGNTGRKAQPSVDVIFSADALAATAINPQVRDFGKVNRRTEIRTSGDTATMGLGPVKPGKRVEIELVYIYRNDEAPYAWDDIFKGVTAARGKIKEGDPGWTTVGRMLFAVFG